MTLILASLFNVAMAKDDPTLADLEKIAISDTMVMMPMRDGMRLATDIYRPKNAKGKVPLIFLKTPYDFNKLEGQQLKMVYDAVERGYAYAIQNERGRFYSEGEWELLGNPRTDGYDALTWFADQDWSNGNVGTIGCSSSAEWQLALAAQNHPAHKSMVPMSAGAGIGRVDEFYEQGNWYKGGVHQTLFSTWLYWVQQGIRPQFPSNITQEQRQMLRKIYDLNPKMPEVDWKKQLKTLPSIKWVESAGGNNGPTEELMTRLPGDPAWEQGGLYHDDEDFGVPAFWFNTWFDVSQGPNLALFNHVRAKASDKIVRDNQYMMVAPTLHCGFFRTPENEDLIVGELNVGDATYNYNDLIFDWFDYTLKGAKNNFVKKTPHVQYYTMGKNRWETADSWPPADVVKMTMYLDSAGQANSLYGNGTLSAQQGEGAASDSFIYDPMNPVPSLGGGVCCNGGASDGGSFDQRAIEARADVLVFSSEPLEKNVQVTGSVWPTLFVSSDAKDTDFTVKLVDVYPDGTAYNVDDTIFRARYREGYDKAIMMNEGEVYELHPTPMSTSYQFKAGHRMRVEVSSSKFPQYMRNLNTGGNNYDETEGVTAKNTLYHSAEHPSHIVLEVKPEK